MKKRPCVHAGMVLLLLLLSCQSEPITEELARQIALEHVRDPKMYEKEGYDPNLLPPPRVDRFDRGMTFGFYDTLQNVDIFFVVYNNGTTRYTFSKGWYDGYKEGVRKLVAKMYEMTKIDTSLVAGRYVDGPDTLDIRAGGTYVHRLQAPNDSVLVDTGAWRFGEPTDFSNTIIFDSIRFVYFSFYRLNLVLSDKGVALVHYGLLEGDTSVAFARPAFPTKDVIPDGLAHYIKKE